MPEVADPIIGGGLVLPGAPASAAWQLPVCHFYDFVTGIYKATLPVDNLSWGSGLNFDVGSCSGFVPLVDPEVRALDPWDATVEGKSVMVVDVGGTITEAFVVWTRNRKKTKQGLTLTGKTILSWLLQRAPATDYSNPPQSGISPVSAMTYWSVQPADPTLIAAQVLSDALSNYRFNGVTTGMNVLGGLGILINGAAPSAGAPVTPIPAWQSPTFPYASMQSLATIVGQLTQLGWLVGFDIGIDVTYSNGPRSPLIGTINIDYKRRGRTADLNGVVIDMNRALDYDFTGDASKSGSTLYESGVPGSLYIEDNVLPRAQGWPLLEQIISRSTLSGPSAAAAAGLLAAIANSDAFLLSYPVYAPTVTMPLWGSDPKLGDFLAGDDARLLMEPDFNFPDGFDDDWRIVGWNATQKSQGVSSIDLTLNVPASASATGPATS